MNEVWDNMDGLLIWNGWGSFVGVNSWFGGVVVYWRYCDWLMDINNLFDYVGLVIGLV